MSDQSVERAEGGEPDLDLAELARILVRSKNRVSELEQAIKDEKDVQEDVQMRILEKTEQTGISSFKIPEGYSFEVQPKIKAWVLAENRDAAMEWLRENGYGKVIQPNYNSLQAAIKDMIQQGKEIPEYVNVEGYSHLSIRSK